MSSRHKESNTFEEFTSRVFAPMSRDLGIIGSNLGMMSNASGSNSVGSVGHGSTQLAAALLDHQKSTKTRERELSQHTITISTGGVTDHPSPRPLRKLHHPFKSSSSSSSGSSMMGTGGVKKSSSVGAANIGSAAAAMMMHSPPDSPTLQQQMRRFK